MDSLKEVLVVNTIGLIAGVAIGEGLSKMNKRWLKKIDKSHGIMRILRTAGLIVTDSAIVGLTTGIPLAGLCKNDSVKAVMAGILIDLSVEGLTKE